MCKIVRRIRDNVHGSIGINKIENLIIEHPAFQRLRHIHQTGLLFYAFPGATHTRFEHSLGTMHLAKTAWQKLSSNQQQLTKKMSCHPNFQEQETPSREIGYNFTVPTIQQCQKVLNSSKLKQILSIAALLHDIGHPPFSHSGEYFLPSRLKFMCFMRKTSYPSYIKKYFEKFYERESQRINHETYSLLVIYHVLSDVRLTDSTIPLTRDVLSVLFPQIKPTEESMPFMRQGQSLCHEILSGDFDVDRMDYLLRDSYNCGVVYGIFDAERILDSLAVYSDPISQNIHLAIRLSGLAAFEDYLRSRHSMYWQLYFHKTAAATDAMIKHLADKLGSWSIPCKVEDYILWDEQKFLEELSREIQHHKEHQRLSELMRGLFQTRRLWKRFYEIIEKKSENSIKKFEYAKNLLEQNSLPYATIISSRQLVEKTKSLGNIDTHYLKLIKSDTDFFPRVYPIESYSELIKQGSSDIAIRRIYTDTENNIHKKTLENLRSHLTNNHSSLIRR